MMIDKNDEMGDNERLDDLQCNGYKLLQNTACFCFGIDAVLLSSFTQVEENNMLLDMCTGNGVIPILIKGKNPEKKVHYTGIEIQEISYILANKNIVLNGLTQDIHIIKGNVNNLKELVGNTLYDVVTCNPPYMNENHGIINPQSAKAIARHELLCTLEDIIREASKHLKVKGHLYMVHRPRRLVELFLLMEQYHLEPKVIRMVHPYVDKDANMVLIEAVKCGNRQLQTLPPLIVYNRDGSYTNDLLQMYNEK